MKAAFFYVGLMLFFVVLDWIVPKYPQIKVIDESKFSEEAPHKS